ncbi:hypothetical protein GW750_06665 [bacterium]|nr:hypothetical protein [bacterium]
MRIISRAIAVDFIKSFEAHVVIASFQKNNSSAALHHNNLTNSSRNFALEYKYVSSCGSVHVTHNACHLETIEIFSTGSDSGNVYAVMACHNS